MLNRVIAASAALVLAVAAATGLFVTKIARSYAAPTDSGGTFEPRDDNGVGGQASRSSTAHDQPPAGRSHGS